MILIFINDIAGRHLVVRSSLVYPLTECLFSQLLLSDTVKYIVIYMQHNTFIFSNVSNNDLLTSHDFILFYFILID